MGKLAITGGKPLRKKRFDPWPIFTDKEKKALKDVLENHDWGGQPFPGKHSDAFAKKFDEAFDNGDAAALASLFTDDAVFVTPGGMMYGREAIEKYWVETFQQGHFSNHLNKADQYSPHLIGTTGNEVWRTGEWSFTVQGKSGDPIKLKGYWSAINVREGDTWKIQMLTFNVSPPPAATPSATTSPNNQ